MNIKELSANSNSTVHRNEFLYNGKMMQDEQGLNWLDYGARFYDPVLGRWHSVDPLCQINRRWGPHSYAYNNPTIFTDPDGMLPAGIHPKYPNGTNGLKPEPEDEEKKIGKK